MRSLSRCFHDYNLHPRVTVLWLKRITWALLLCNKKYRLPCSFKRKRALFRCQALLVGNFLRFARARAHLRALITQKLSAVATRNATMRNHLSNFIYIVFVICTHPTFSREIFHVDIINK